MARIIDLDELIAALTDDDMFVLTDVSEDEDKRISALALAAYVLLGKVIGGSAAGDITTNNAIQELLNKRLTNPKINSSNSTSVTSEDLDKLHAVTVSAALINYLSGASSNIQSQLNTKANISMVGTRPHYYVHSAIASGSTMEISEAVIRAALGLASDRRVAPTLLATIYSVVGSTMSPLGGLVGYTVSVGTGGILDKITYSGLSSGTSYKVMVVCYDTPLGGGS